jgi:regulator of protease activity HflC (stomatin/prohibitin superfamily)
MGSGRILAGAVPDIGEEGAESPGDISGRIAVAGKYSGGGHEMIPINLAPYAVFFILIIGFLALSLKIVPEYQRLVVFFLGRFQGIKKPGLRIVVPGIQQAVRVDLRVITMDVPSQDVISRDNVTVRVNAVLYFRVVDPEKAIIQVEDYYNATSQLAQTTLRSVLGQHELDEMLTERDKMNADLQVIIDKQSDAWGIKVSNVEIKHVDLNENMIRAIAKQAEAERERRAKVIHAEGELQASEKLLAAANVISQNPQALQLRYLQTLNDISNENATTVVFPLPIDLIDALMPKKE